MYIDNQIPTDGELAVYFLEEFNSSVLLTFSSENTLRWSDDIEKATSLLQRTEYENFTKLCLSSIFFMLTEINNVSRNDDLWNKTNKRPTLSRVCDYFSSKKSSELNEPELFASIGLKLHGGSNYFGEDEWIQLYSQKTYDPKWVVASALLHEINIGDSIKSFSRLVNKLNIQENINTEISNLISYENRFLKKWGENAINQIKFAT